MDTKPCICIVSALYLPSLGGVEVYTAHLAQALAALDYRIIIVTSNTHTADSQETVNGIEILRLPCHSLLGGRYPVPHKTALYKQLWAWLEQQHIDYSIINTRFYPLSRAGLALAQSKHIAPVLIEHGSAHLTIGNFLADRGIEAIEHALTLSNKHLPASYFAVSSKASTWLKHFKIESGGELSNSIDADQYLSEASSRDFCKELELPPDTFVVAFVGRLVKEKGILDLARASQQFNKTDHIAILVAGDGPLFESVQHFNSECFHVLGKLTRSDTATLLCRADILCLPSRSEGFATTLLEAAACYTPPIVTDVGGVDELVINESYGTILADHKPQTITHALREAMSNRQRIVQQGHNIGVLVRKEYSWRKTAEKAIEACRSAQNYSTNQR